MMIIFIAIDIIVLISISIVFLIKKYESKKLSSLSSNKINKTLPLCPKCKKPISGNKNFCTSCGEKINNI